MVEDEDDVEVIDAGAPAAEDAGRDDGGEGLRRGEEYSREAKKALEKLSKTCPSRQEINKLVAETMRFVMFKTHQSQAAPIKCVSRRARPPARDGTAVRLTRARAHFRNGRPPQARGPRQGGAEQRLPGAGPARLHHLAGAGAVRAHLRPRPARGEAAGQEEAHGQVRGRRGGDRLGVRDVLHPREPASGRPPAAVPEAGGRQDGAGVHDGRPQPHLRACAGAPPEPARRAPGRTRR